MRNSYQTVIEKFYAENSRMPSYSEMMALFGLKSKNAIYKIVNKMVAAGIVAKDHLGRLIPSDTFREDMTSVPMLGYVTAGFPASVEEELTDTVKLESLLIQDKTKSYLLEVDGDSMIDAHIEKGDLVLVEKTDQAKDGQIVVAEIDGEFTLKYFRKQGNKVWLEPANKNYKPLHPTHSLHINAVLKAVIRKY
jgi:SOS regulatory protein LexA